jgi:hypothetical protein
MRSSGWRYARHYAHARGSRLQPPRGRHHAGITPTTLARWAAQGRGPACSRSGDRRGRVWYRGPEIELWLGGLDHWTKAAPKPHGLAARAWPKSQALGAAGSRDLLEHQTPRFPLVRAAKKISSAFWGWGRAENRRPAKPPRPLGAKWCRVFKKWRTVRVVKVCPTGRGSWPGATSESTRKDPCGRGFQGGGRLLRSSGSVRS